MQPRDHIVLVYYCAHWPTHRWAPVSQCCVCFCVVVTAPSVNHSLVPSHSPCPYRRLLGRALRPSRVWWTRFASTRTSNGLPAMPFSAWRRWVSGRVAVVGDVGVCAAVGWWVWAPCGAGVSKTTPLRAWAPVPPACPSLLPPPASNSVMARHTQWRVVAASVGVPVLLSFLPQFAACRPVWAAPLHVCIVRPGVSSR